MQRACRLLFFKLSVRCDSIIEECISEEYALPEPTKRNSTKYVNSCQNIYTHPTVSKRDLGPYVLVAAGFDVALGGTEIFFNADFGLIGPFSFGVTALADTFVLSQNKMALV